MNDLQSDFIQLKSKMFYFNIKEKLSVIGYLGVQSYKHLTEGQY